MADPNPCRAAERGADVIRRGFDDFHSRFRSINRRAQARFEDRDWEGIRRDTVKRLGLHSQAVDETLEALRDELKDRLAERQLWRELKEAYSQAILGADDFELAQTFFNSLTRKVFPHDGVDPGIDYVSRDFPLPFRGWEMASARMYAVRRLEPGVVRRVLEDGGFRVPFVDLDADSGAAAAQLRKRVVEAFGGEEIEAVDVLRPVFVRNKGAYLVGRIRCGERLLPLVIALVNEPEGLRVDAVLDTEEEASIVFSFARWYFHADLQSPREVIGFLHSILPRKRVSELYISLGHHKHGKTEFYGDLMHYIADSDEQFVFAPGQRGLVMSVFTLPSFPFVFKVIKDSFPPQKRMTRDDVRLKYREVLQHDRVGRLVDYQEFEHLKFARGRFEPALLAELLEDAGMTVEIEGDDVVIRHTYVGRRVTPLDLYLADAEPEAAEAAVVDWGFALKDLAAANIFAGDMLLKNFGVTRHGRVVFYDYDELSSLSECRFRRMPPARDHYEEMAAEPWFSVSDRDIFPEEMRTFFGLRGELREVFGRRHGELFEPAYWQSMKRRNEEGEVIDFFPYPRHRRLASRSRRDAASVAV